LMPDPVAGAAREQKAGEAAGKENEFHAESGLIAGEGSADDCAGHVVLAVAGQGRAG
jgi:hypothetical protein